MLAGSISKTRPYPARMRARSVGWIYPEPGTMAAIAEPITIGIRRGRYGWNTTDMIAKPTAKLSVKATKPTGRRINTRNPRGSRGGRPRQGYGTYRRLGAKQ